MRASPHAPAAPHSCAGSSFPAAAPGTPAGRSAAPALSSDTALTQAAPQPMHWPEPAEPGAGSLG